VGSWDFDVCIVGTGRVGLPLGLSFVDAGVSATGLDVDAELVAKVNAGIMPFAEPGYDELIKSGQFRVHLNPKVVSHAQALVITVGTPLLPHIETDLSQVQKVLQQIKPYLRAGQLIVLRSTVAPRTTLFVQRWLDTHTILRVGKDIGLAFCPERLVEGQAKLELKTLPQVIGVEDEVSRRMADALFRPLAPELLFTNYVTAELVKLANNTARYVQFAFANQMALISDSYGASIYEVRELANYKYPRNPIAKPGFTAGTCLRKDFGMLNEAFPSPDLLVAAWKINEYMPQFLVHHARQRMELFRKKAVILGFTFKGESDDMRDSLGPKLRRYLLRELPESVDVSDYHLPSGTIIDSDGVQNQQEADVLAQADVVFVSVDHLRYGEVLKDWAFDTSKPDALVVDIWNVGGTNRIFYTARELVESANAQEARAAV
jgi:UDP-N-acetyl-D-mannosaminuronic acid dehydrogenase